MILTKKYAYAFINTFGSELSHEDIENISLAADFLKNHRRAVFLLKVPKLDQEIKKRGLREFATRFKLAESIRHLQELLFKHGRAHLFAAVMQEIVSCYRQRNNIMVFKVTSSGVLPEKSRVVIEQFMGRETPGAHLYRYTLDVSLIAGVRIQSDTLLWEYSIDKQLRELARVYRP